MEPKGTRPISTCPAESRSQSSEPETDADGEHASNRVTVVSSPPRTLFEYTGNCARNSAPYSQNQEMPRIDRKTVRFSRAKPMLRQVSDKQD
jgi:hypothetical protein